MSGWTRLVESRLLRKGGIYVFSSWISQGVLLLAWLILPWKLSAEEVGQFALISFVIDLATRLILMGMDSAILRFYVEKERRREWLRAACMWLGIGCVIASGVFWLTRDLVPEFIKGLASIYADLLWLALGAAAATAFATIVFSHYVAGGEAPQYGKLTILRSGLLGGGYVAAAWLGLGVAGLVGAQLVTSLVIAAAFFGAKAKHAPQKLSPQAMREMAGYGMPMVVYAVFSLLSDYTGRLFLDRQVTIGDLGVFQFYYQIANQVNGIWASLNRAWTPHVFQLLNTSRVSAFGEIFRATTISTSVYALGLAGFMLAGVSGLWGIVVPPAFHARIDLFYLLLLGPLYCCVYTAIYPVFYFNKNTVRISIVQSVVSAITIVMTIGFTTRWKADGAALGWVLGLFIAPFLYLAGFPKLVAELKPVAGLLAVWGAAGALVAAALRVMHSPALAMVALLATAIGLTAFVWMRPRAATS